MFPPPNDSVSEMSLGLRRRRGEEGKGKGGGRDDDYANKSHRGACSVVSSILPEK